MAKKGDHRHGPVRKDIRPEATDRRWAPLNVGFMVTSMIGFFVSVLYVKKFSVPMAIAFAVVFACMFLASMVSMSRASPDAQLGARPIK